MKNKKQKYDIIGDIHGHADPLRALLEKLGYDETDGAYRHPERTVIFMGDFVDRGPKIRETLQIVKAMMNAAPPEPARFPPGRAFHADAGRPLAAGLR